MMIENVESVSILRRDGFTDLIYIYISPAPLLRAVGPEIAKDVFGNTATGSEPS